MPRKHTQIFTVPIYPHLDLLSKLWIYRAEARVSLPYVTFGYESQSELSNSIVEHLLQQGERLFREEPLFLVPRSSGYTNSLAVFAYLTNSRLAEQSPIALIYEALGTLNESQIETFSELSYIPPEGEFETGEEYAQQVPLAIVQTNAVTAGEGVGVFPQMARLNHGCSSAFSAVYSWREDEGVIVVHAIRPIKKGEV